VQAGIGAEPVCCGNDCLFGKCKDGVFKGKTRISRGTTEGCGAVTSDRNGGVMCCYDGEGNPDGAAADAKAEGGEEEQAEEGEDAEGGDEEKAEGGEDEKAEGGADEKEESPDDNGKAEAEAKKDNKRKKPEEKKSGADAKKDDESKTAKGG
jgi:hypothetical protein